MKAYLDSNIVSSIVRDDVHAESAALDLLLRARERGDAELVTSELTLQEINACPERYRPPLERTFRLLVRVPIVRWGELVGINVQISEYSCLNSPVIMNDPMFDALLALGLGHVDAQHVFVAAKTACDTFLTCDGGILHHVASIKGICGLVVEKPSTLVARAGW